MFINKFNQLIRNKWVWGIFAGIVCFLFVAPDLFRRGGEGEERAYGRIDGKPVTFEEFQNALLAARVDELTRSGGMRDVTEYSVLSARAWRFVAAAQKARDLGMVVSKEECKRLIAAMFSDGTGFNQSAYIGFLGERLGCTPLQFEKALATMVLVRKVADAHAHADWLSPSFLDVQSRGQTDKYTLRLVTVSNEFAKASVEPSRETLEAYYEQNKAAYRVPDQVSVRYVAFHDTDYTDKVGDIDEDDIRLRYDDNPDKYTEVVDGVTTNLSFEAAQPRIERELRNEKALHLAVEAADAFAEKFYNDRRDPKLEADLLSPDFFERAATEGGFSVITTALFSANGPVIGIETGASHEFSDTAFGLAPEASYSYYSTPIEGRHYVYVLAYNEFAKAHDPGLDGVLPAVTHAVVEDERNRMFGEDFRKRFDEFTKKSKEGDFEQAATDAGFVVSTNMTLTAYDARLLPGDPHDWLSILPRLDKDVDSPAVFYNGGAAFVHVLDRAEGDSTLRDNFRERYAESMANSIEGSLADNWLEVNYAAMNPDVPVEKAEDEVEE